MLKSLITLSLAAAASASGLNGYWVYLIQVEDYMRKLTDIT